MTFDEIDIGEIDDRLSSTGILVEVGCVVFRLRTRLPGMGTILRRMYGHYPVPVAPQIVDFDLRVDANGREWPSLTPLANFWVDGNLVRTPFPRALAWPYLEWGANYAFGTRSAQYLLIHAAALERDGKVLVMPGRPGAGKSTLTASLMLAGWRYFSDEFLILDPATGNALPFPRPISLKEASIDVVRGRSPGAVFSPIFEGTHKGAIAYLRISDASVRRMHEPALPAWIVFPRYSSGSGLLFEEKSKARAFLEIADNSFNYEARRRHGFEETKVLIDRCDCFDLTYDDLDGAIAALGALS